MSEPTTTSDSRTYQRIADVIRYLTEHQEQQPTLAEVAQVANLSEFHLQRLFSQWAGVTPKQFLQYLTLENARQQLRASSVMDAAYSSGLSGPNRLHDLMVKCTGMTPGEYRQEGSGLAIVYGLHASPFGTALIAQAPRGICKISFADDDAGTAKQVDELHAEWSLAHVHRDDDAVAVVAEQIFRLHNAPQPLNVLLRGTTFQIQVWEALLRIPHGHVRSYGDVANAIGSPQATRAVASAIARNAVGFLIPCHRVIRGSGHFGEYRWGGERKQAIIGWERSQLQKDQGAQAQQ